MAYVHHTRFGARHPFRLALFAVLLGALFAAIVLPGCEFDNLKDQQYGPIDPATGGGTDTTGNGGGSDTTGNGGGSDTTGNGGGDTTAVTIRVAVSPTSATIKTGESTQLTATVTGTSNTSVTWLVISGPGTVTQQGEYQAPGSVNSNLEVAEVRVVSNVKPSAFATAFIAVTQATTGGGGTGGDTADAGEVCFERDVLPLFQSNCAMSGCHDVQTARKGYTLTTYDGIMRGIAAGRPGDSEIYEKITEDRSDKRMPPPPRPALTAQQIATIRQWIQQGARNTICPTPTNSCDTTTVTYSGYVRPTLDKYCIGCHSGPNPSKGLDLTQYDVVRQVALDKRLYGVIARLPGFIPMPYGGAKLPDCDIRKIGAWVNRGANRD